MAIQDAVRRAFAESSAVQRYMGMAGRQANDPARVAAHGEALRLVSESTVGSADEARWMALATEAFHRTMPQSTWGGDPRIARFIAAALDAGLYTPAECAEFEAAADANRSAAALWRAAGQPQWGETLDALHAAQRLESNAWYNLLTLARSRLQAML